MKHEFRYFFGTLKKDDAGEVLDPGDTLNQLFEYARDAGLFVTLQSGTCLYRARKTP